MFEHVEPYAGDPILTLNEDFQKDPRPGKINLSIGIYFDDAGRLPVMDACARPRPRCCPTSAPSPTCRWGCGQLPPGRCRPCCSAPTTRLLAAGRVATIQTLGGSGGLKVGATSSSAGSRLAGLGQRPDLGQPQGDVRGRGLSGQHLPLLRRGHRRPALRRHARRAARPARRSIVLLHACCHNPTGVDLTRAQWTR
jgi:aromatic-amino-acid transaminase